MKYLLQRPLKDEVLASCLIRTCRKVNVHPLSLAAALTGGLWRPSFFNVSHTTELAAALWLPPTRLLFNHTHFPYSTYFFEQALLKKNQFTALAGSGNYKPAAAVSRSISMSVRFRRYCHHCAAEEVKHWGVSYWHREHNLPGVVICLTHGTVLRQTVIPTASASALDLHLPHEVSGVPMVNQGPSAFQIELARLSLTALRWPGGRNAQVPRDFYRSAFTAAGLVSPNRRISQELLASFLRRMAGANLSYLGLSPRDERLHWAALMTRVGVVIPYATLKHLVLRAALDLANSVDAAGVQYRPVGSAPRPTDARDLLFSAQLREKTMQLVEKGKTAPLKDCLMSIGAYGPYRHNPTRYPTLSLAAMEHRQSPASVRIVPKR